MSRTDAPADRPPTGLEDGATGTRLTIDLEALQWNYRHLQTIAPASEIGASVKADAYGLGIEAVARALWAAGCRTYFVADLNEARELRALLPQDAIIYALNGLAPGLAEAYAAARIRPA